MALKKGITQVREWKLNIGSRKINLREGKIETKQRRPNINIFGDAKEEKLNSGAELIYLNL